MTALLEAALPRRQVLLGKAFSLPVLLLASLVTCVYLLVSPSMADPDIWWHLRNAEYLLKTHSFITKDTYSFTTLGAPWLNHEWLAELPFYFGWKLLGTRGLFLVTVGAVECIFLGVYRLACAHSNDAKAALPVTIIAAVLSTVSFSARTLLFGWIGLVAELLILQRVADARRGPDRQTQAARQALWMLPLLFALWVNTHGSWLIGMVILFACVGCGYVRVRAGAIESSRWTREQGRSMLLATGLSVVALFINPYGYRLVFYPFDLAFRQKLNIASVEEWRTLDFHSPRGHILLVCLAALFVVQLVRGRTWTLYELALLCIGVYASFTYSRFLFLAAILIFPLLAKELAGLAPYAPARDKPWLNAVFLCGLLSLAVHHFPSRPQPLAADAESYPDRALPFLSSFHPQGNVFNDFLWGGYLEWHTRQIPVFVDSRIDIFEYSGVFKDYLQAVRLDDSLAILTRYKIRYVLFEQHTPLVYLLQHTIGWKVDYQDGTTILLERMAPGASLAAHE